MRRTLVATFRRIMRLYFRDIERVGETPAADTRGRVFVSNHYNALIDPILVLTDAPARSRRSRSRRCGRYPGCAGCSTAPARFRSSVARTRRDKDAGANDAAFDRIASHLAGGGNILIFPEGTSHSEPQLAPLRTGAARMLLAAERHGSPELTFQAAALEFDARDDFRSRCLVLWGPVRKFADIPGDGEERVHAATATDGRRSSRSARRRLDAMTSAALIARVAEMLANDAGDATLQGWNAIGRQVELAGRTLRTRRRAARRRDRRAGRRVLRRARASRHADAGHGDTAPTPREPSSWLRRIAIAPLAASGFALYAIPYFIPRFVARKTDPTRSRRSSSARRSSSIRCGRRASSTASFVMLPPPLSLVAAFVALASPFAALAWLDDYWQRRPHVSSDELAGLARLRIAARTAIDEARSKLPS